MFSELKTLRLSLKIFLNAVDDLVIYKQFQIPVRKARFLAHNISSFCR